MMIDNAHPVAESDTDAPPPSPAEPAEPAEELAKEQEEPTPVVSEGEPVAIDCQTDLAAPDAPDLTLSPTGGAEAAVLAEQIATLNNVQELRLGLAADSAVFKAWTKQIHKGFRKAYHAPRGVVRVNVSKIQDDYLRQACQVQTNELGFYGHFIKKHTKASLQKVRDEVKELCLSTSRELHAIHAQWVYSRKRYKRTTRTLRNALDQLRKAEADRNAECRANLDSGIVMNTRLRYRLDRLQGRVDAYRTVYNREWRLMEPLRTSFAVEMGRLHVRVVTCHEEWTRAISHHLERLKLFYTNFISEVEASGIALEGLGVTMDEPSSPPPRPLPATCPLLEAVVYHVPAPPTATIEVYGSLQVAEEPPTRRVRGLAEAAEPPPMPPPTSEPVDRLVHSTKPLERDEGPPTPPSSPWNTALMDAQAVTSPAG